MTAPTGVGRYLASLRLAAGLRRYCDAIGAHIHIRLKEAP